jgi:outer membrane immunogenic protein
MRKTAITLAGTTAIGLCLGVSAGSAADLLPMKAPPVAAAPFTWTGCYGGFQFGGAAQTDGFATNSAFFSDIEGFSGNGANGLGVIAGGQIGCNYQISQLVVGIEADGVWSSVQNTAGTTFGTGVDQEGIQLRSRNNWDADVALRLGAAFDRLLIYGKGGVAWGGFNFRETFSFGGGTTTEQFNGNATLPGLLLGVGMEYAFLPNWTAKIEYNYIAFEQQQVNFTFSEGGVVIPADALGQNFGATKQIIKVGVNYKFW